VSFCAWNFFPEAALARSQGGFFMPINRNVLLLAVAVLCIAVGVLGYKVYEDNRQPKGVQINLGPGGISVDKK
jgi:hypothetical protein